MIELPECNVLAAQINDTLVGKIVRSVAANVHPHAFAAYSGDPAAYDGRLRGKTLTAANPGTGYTCGGNTEICFENQLLVLSTPIKYHAAGAKLPAKHQLLIAFTDDSHLSCTVQMWGGMFCYPMNENGMPEQVSVNKTPSPLSAAFDAAYFDGLWNATSEKYSVKAFLATEQRIPGLGNGVLQDILWHAKIHPKTKLSALDSAAKQRLFQSVKSTLAAMVQGGGRDTEKDLFGNAGGYRTVLSNKTLAFPCPACGAGLVRTAYLGGNIYFCPGCQDAL